MMAWDLSANYSFELLRHDIAARVGPQRMAELLPYSRDGLTIVTSAKKGSSESVSAGSATPRQLSFRTGERHIEDLSLASPASGQYLAQFTSALAHGHPAVRDLLLGGVNVEATGSNNWVVDGTMTASGKPLLANDPHLATHVPSLWYLAHVAGGDLDVIGA